MSRIGSVPRDLDPVALRGMRRNFEDVTGRMANANMSRSSNIKTKGLRTADLGTVQLISSVRSIGHPLGAMPVRIDLQPDNGAVVYVERTTDKLIWVSCDRESKVRIRVFL